MMMTNNIIPISFPDLNQPMSLAKTFQVATDIMRLSQDKIEDTKAKLRTIRDHAKREAMLSDIPEIKERAELMAIRAGRLCITVKVLENSVWQATAFPRERGALNGKERKQIFNLKGVTIDTLGEVFKALEEEGEKIPTVSNIKRLLIKKTKGEREDKEAEDYLQREKKGKKPTASFKVASCLEMINHIPAGSIDLILTDPPYTKDAFPKAVSELAQFSGHALKDGGHLVFETGHLYLFDIFKIIEKEKSLYYRWLLSAILPGASSYCHTVAANSNDKPYLVFKKGRPGPKDRPIFGTIFGQTKQVTDKRYHRWESPIIGLHKILKQFSKVGDRVADPFIGGGTSAIVSQAHGCDFIGSDVDPNAVKIAQKRFKSAQALLA